MTDLEKLGLSIGASVADIKARWRQLLFTVHPDHGGQPDEFHDLLQTYRRAVKDVADRQTADQVIKSYCQPCGGIGHRYVHRGFNSMRLLCLTCLGSGRV